MISIPTNKSTVYYLISHSGDVEIYSISIIRNQNRLFIFQTSL